LTGPGDAISRSDAQLAADDAETEQAEQYS
jgi:hypothetical protein